MSSNQPEIRAAIDGMKLGLAACCLSTLFGGAALITNNADKLEAACASSTPLIQQTSCFVLQGSKVAGRILEPLTAALK